MGLETDQNIVDTYFLISKRVQGGSPANRGLAPLARFWQNTGAFLKKEEKILFSEKKKKNGQ